MSSINELTNKCMKLTYSSSVCLSDETRDSNLRKESARIIRGTGTNNDSKTA